ncbi:hypothetical protein OE88DRAFT_1692989, partial [Heliocybe sulcata]
MSYLKPIYPEVSEQPGLTSRRLDDAGSSHALLEVGFLDDGRNNECKTALASQSPSLTPDNADRVLHSTESRPQCDALTHEIPNKDKPGLDHDLAGGSDGYLIIASATDANKPVFFDVAAPLGCDRASGVKAAGNSFLQEKPKDSDSGLQTAGPGTPIDDYPIHPFPQVSNWAYSTNSRSAASACDLQVPNTNGESHGALRVISGSSSADKPPTSNALISQNSLNGHSTIADAPNNGAIAHSAHLTNSGSAPATTPGSTAHISTEDQGASIILHAPTPSPPISLLLSIRTSAETADEAQTNIASNAATYGTIPKPSTPAVAPGTFGLLPPLIDDNHQQIQDQERDLGSPSDPFVISPAHIPTSGGLPHAIPDCSLENRAHIRISNSDTGHITCGSLTSEKNHASPDLMGVLNSKLTLLKASSTALDVDGSSWDDGTMHLQSGPGAPNVCSSAELANATRILDDNSLAASLVVTRLTYQFPGSPGDALDDTNCDGATSLPPTIIAHTSKSSLSVEDSGIFLDATDTSRPSTATMISDADSIVIDASDYIVLPERDVTSSVELFDLKCCQEEVTSPSHPITMRSAGMLLHSDYSEFPGPIGELGDHPPILMNAVSSDSERDTPLYTQIGLSGSASLARGASPTSLRSGLPSEDLIPADIAPPAGLRLDYSSSLECRSASSSVLDSARVKDCHKAPAPPSGPFPQVSCASREYTALSSPLMNAQMAHHGYEDSAERLAEDEDAASPESQVPYLPPSSPPLSSSPPVFSSPGIVPAPSSRPTSPMRLDVDCKDKDELRIEDCMQAEASSQGHPWSADKDEMGVQDGNLRPSSPSLALAPFTSSPPSSPPHVPGYIQSSPPRRYGFPLEGEDHENLKSEKKRRYGSEELDEERAKRAKSEVDKAAPKRMTVQGQRRELKKLKKPFRSPVGIGGLP